MRVLIGCEYSAVEREAFHKRGHDAWSCDMLFTAIPGQHIRGDVMDAVRSRVWDCIILHPPCTKIALCSNGTYGANKSRHKERTESLDWTEALWRLAISVCGKVALENPKNMLGARIGPCTQKIQPWQFGHSEQKETWLWLHGLPPLVETNNVYESMMKLPKKLRERVHYMSPGSNRGHKRSLSYKGIASAMADQWK